MAVSGLLLNGDGNAFSNISNPIPTSISNARISGSGTLDIEELEAVSLNLQIAELKYGLLNSKEITRNGGLYSEEVGKK
ncbi:hypothetical protein Ancab_010422, partial [Ancistrocladus abbreviatus]